MPKKRHHEGSEGRRPRRTRRAAKAGSAPEKVPGSRDLQNANRKLTAQLRTVRDQQKQLERSRAQYEDLFDFAQVTYALLDTVGVVSTVNLAACRLLNVQRAHLIGRPLLGFVVQQDRPEWLEHLRRCQASRSVVESEVRFQVRGNTAVTCRVYSRRAHYGDRDALPTVIVDQTERLTLDEARLSAERRRDGAERAAEDARSASAAKDRFLATVSHELRTPLTPALFAASRLALWDGIPDEARALAQTIQRNVEYEARLIDDLLDVARINRKRITVRREVIDLHDIVREAIATCEPLAETRTITVAVHLLAEDHYVNADRARLRQVFWNLLNNAVKFTDAGGTIIVRSANVADTVVRVSIRDTGAGLDPRTMAQLFAPFDRQPGGRNSRGGLGLGLAICKGIIGAHDGQIWASSEGPRQGSTFAVELATVPEPQQKAPASVERHAAVHGEPGTHRPRILIVEDDQDSGEMLAEFLSHYGYDVQLASSLQTGILKLDETWDVVLSDIGLPDGSGLEIAQNARKRQQQPRRLIAFTGYGSTDDITASRAAGFDAHVVKPVDLDRLLRMLQSAGTTRLRCG